jgi:hypothetical protein
LMARIFLRHFLARSMAMSALSLTSTGGALFLRRFPCSGLAAPPPAHHFLLLVEDSAAARGMVSSWMVVRQD